MPTYSQLFFAFLQIGFTAFGGAAMAVQLRRYFVDRKNWMEGNAFDSGFALCQVIPGAIIMQLSAYIGLKLKGTKGAIVSFVGFGLPSFLLMLLLAILYKFTKNITMVETILTGLRVIMVAIVAYGAYTFGSKNFQQPSDVVIALVSAALFLMQTHPALVLTVAAMLSLVISNREFFPVTNIVKTNTLPFLMKLLALVMIGTLLLFLLNRSLFALAGIMLHIDLFSFGGGLAAMPIMYHELVSVYHWFDDKTFMDGVILGQVTPVSIIIAATFYGYLHFGIVGGFVATVCVFTPSFLILMGIVPFFDKLSEYPRFNKVINGILNSFVGLLVIVTYRFAIDIQWTMFNTLFAILALILLIRRVNVLWLILMGIVFSIL